MSEHNLDQTHAPNYQETIFVLMNDVGNFLCARYRQRHDFSWSHQIGCALQGRDEEHLDRQLSFMMDSLAERGWRLRPFKASICRADIWLSKTSEQNLDTRLDHICLMQGDILSFKGFSTRERPASRLSKAVGFPAPALSASVRANRFMRLTHLRDYSPG